MKKEKCALSTCSSPMFCSSIEFGAKDSHITCRGPLPFSSCNRNGTPFFDQFAPRQPSAVGMLLNRNDQQQGCPSYTTDLRHSERRLLCFSFPQIIASQILWHTIGRQYCKDGWNPALFKLENDQTNEKAEINQNEEGSQVFQADVKEASMLLALGDGNRTFYDLIFV
jgi:hypothetical protein